MIEWIFNLMILICNKYWISGIVYGLRGKKIKVTNQKNNTLRKDTGIKNTYLKHKVMLL